MKTTKKNCNQIYIFKLNNMENQNSFRQLLTEGAIMRINEGSGVQPTQEELETVKKVIRVISAHCMKFTGKLSGSDNLFDTIYDNGYYEDWNEAVDGENPRYEPATWDYPGSDEQGWTAYQCSVFIGIEKDVCNSVLGSLELNKDFFATVEESKTIYDSIVVKNKIEEINAACNSDKYYKIGVSLEIETTWNSEEEYDEDGPSGYMKTDEEVNEKKIIIAAVRDNEAIAIEKNLWDEYIDEFVEDELDVLENEFEK